MRIVEAKRRRGKLYDVVCEDGDTVLMDARVFEEHGLAEGSVLSEQAWEALLAESLYRRAREKALWLLSVKERSKAELREKLREEAPANVAEETADEMERLGLLDDERYAVRLAEELRCVRHFSRRHTEQELRRRGIDRAVSEQASWGVDTTDEEQALALLHKKRYNKDCDEKTRRRMADLLARHGYDYDTIRHALAAFE